MKQVVLVTGTPGTGKTTISRLISIKLNAEHIDLTTYANVNHLIISRDKLRETDIIDLNTVRRSITQEIKKAPGSIVIDGHYASDVTKIGLVTRIFVLRREPWLLIEELTKRGYSKLKIQENVEAELLGVCLNETAFKQDPKKICEIDTSHQNPEDTALLIISILSGAKPCGFGQIDWMNRSETEELVKELT
ncbi:MAG: AAA family ATPase [Candidatus Bathyarchaeota archaeon]|nr:AAA family ATPase [Candidatus Bathyarchaeota archaeon]